MEKIDYLFTNALVLTMDKQMHQYDPGVVAIKDNIIVAVGSGTDISQKYTPNKIIDCNGKVLMPGLINAHTHVPMALVRGLADDLRLDVWLMGYIMPVEREFVTPDFIRLGTKLGCAEMIRSGITTFADMYYFEDQIAEATAELGMRAICGESLIKFPTPDASSYDEALEYSRNFISKWIDHPLIIPTIAPHAPYTITKEIMEESVKIALEFDIPIHTHLSETAVEVENLRSEFGMPVIPYVKKLNLFNAKVIAAHCVHVDEGEMHTLQHYDVGVAHNPSSNLKLGSGIAPINKMIELGINVGIGTDGPASNNDLDMFEEMRLASFIAKGSSGDPTALPATTTLKMATSMGAQAIHIGDITGSIEPGKRADIILIDLNDIHNSPRFYRNSDSIYSQIVYSTKSNDVTDVMIDGKFVMRDKELLTVRPDELIQHSQEYARKIDIFLLKREQSVFSKLIAIGGASEAESFEVQSKVRINDRQMILNAIEESDIEIIRRRHYKEYDVYFMFEEYEQGLLRYREDHFVGENDEITKVRTRLTHIGVTREATFPQQVLLSRSRYIAPGNQSLRFYREYFKPCKEFEIEKDRLRFLVKFHDTEFFINVDEIQKPDIGNFLEIKSRTWSRNDAEQKSKLVSELIKFLGVSVDNTLAEDYIDLIK